MKTDFEILETPAGQYRLMAAGFPYDDYASKVAAEEAQRELEACERGNVVELDARTRTPLGHGGVEGTAYLAWLADVTRRRRGGH